MLPRANGDSGKNGDPSDLTIIHFVNVFISAGDVFIIILLHSILGSALPRSIERRVGTLSSAWSGLIIGVAVRRRWWGA